jgi:hypothetical protein
MTDPTSRIRPEDVHTPEDFERFLVEQRAEREGYYRTPTWERMLLCVVLAALVLVIVSAIASLVVT